MESLMITQSVSCFKKISCWLLTRERGSQDIKKKKSDRQDGRSESSSLDLTRFWFHKVFGVVQGEDGTADFAQMVYEDWDLAERCIYFDGRESRTWGWIKHDQLRRPDSRVTPGTFGWSSWPNRDRGRMDLGRKTKDSFGHIWLFVTIIHARATQ